MISVEDRYGAAGASCRVYPDQKRRGSATPGRTAHQAIPPRV